LISRVIRISLFYQNPTCFFFSILFETPPDSKVKSLSILNQKYEHELAQFKRHKFAQKNEHLTAKQIHLWDEAVEEDIAADELV
jgi:hypothetical protein